MRKAIMFYKREATKTKTKPAIKKRLFNISKKIHKYLGLLLLLFAIWMSISGILLNHPELISGISVPGALVPEEYHLENWNRGTLIKAVFSKQHPQRGFVCGRQGVWSTKDGGKTFQNIMAAPFPESRYYRKTRDILLTEANGNEYLLAATEGGFFIYDLTRNNWQKVKTQDENEDFVKLLQIENTITAVSESGFYRSSTEDIFSYKFIDTERTESERSITLVELFFEVHSGKAWGLPGQLLIDFTGIVVIFLSISAFYLWILPKKLGSNNHLRTKIVRKFKFHFKYHKKLGIWTAVILLMLSVTGLFMRPPLLVALVDGELPLKYYPGLVHDNPWHAKIRNAMYDKSTDKIIIDAKDGYWTAEASLAEPFRKEEPPIPIFPMGATVFEMDSSGNKLIGSFLGLHRISHKETSTFDYISKKDTVLIEAARPGVFMVTGYFRAPDGEEYVNTQYDGLMNISSNQRAGMFEMPAEIADDYRMPLWNFMFELHNGRIFQFVVGKYYILIIPLTSILFFVLTVTGIFDWLFLRFRKRRI